MSDTGSNESGARKVRLQLSAQAERYARRDAPRETRLMAARGALPFESLELATVLFALMHDPDAEVKATARESLEALPDVVIGAVVQGNAHPALLSHLADRFADDEARLEKIALNPATDDATIVRLAACPHKKIVDIISNNQARMQRTPEIVDALGCNPLTGRAVIERILSFLGATDDRDHDSPRDVETISDDEAEAALRAVLGDEYSEFTSQLITETDKELSEEELASGNLYNVIQNMTVFQKIQLARLGNKEARGLLVRDRNKLVAIAAVMSPKISDSEIVTIAQSRNVCDEVLRTVARNRDWTRNYQVKLALVANPKCPQSTAIQFINYLQDKDLRTLMRSRDVPKAISTHARRILMKKGKV